MRLAMGFSESEVFVGTFTVLDHGTASRNWTAWECW